MPHICLGATDVTANTADKVPDLIGTRIHMTVDIKVNYYYYFKTY